MTADEPLYDRKVLIVEGGGDLPMRLKIETRTAESMSSVDYCVCADLTLPLMLPDNMIGQCVDCEQPVQYRPNNLKFKKLCGRCAYERSKAGHA